jgi:hypothetical protein
MQYARAQGLFCQPVKKLRLLRCPFLSELLLQKKITPGFGAKNGENGVSYAKFFGVGIRNPSSADQC